MKSDSGTYLLILRSNSKATIEVGKLGKILLKRGYYIYVGSAFGQGGLRARVSRHFRKDKPTHWHIDYLSKFLTPVAVWYTYHQKPLEHKWAKFLSNMRTITPIPGFGCSDCSCQSHLFYYPKKPDLVFLSKQISSTVQIWVKRFTDYPVE